MINLNHLEFRNSKKELFYKKGKKPIKQKLLKMEIF